MKKEKIYIIQRVKIEKNGCWEWQLALAPDGTGLATYKNKHWRASRLSYFVFKGPIPEGMLVCHTCDNPSCCNPDHLFLGTPKDNMQDREKKGRGRKGRRFHYKWDKKIAKDCFDLWRVGTSMLEIAKDFEIPYCAVYYLTQKHAKEMGFDFSTHPVKSNKEYPKFLKISREKCAEILTLRQKGKTFFEISQLVNVKKSTCKYICANPQRLKED